MNEAKKDRRVLDHIEQLISEEQQLYGQEAISDTERDQLERIRIELDQCWDLLRQRRALRRAGEDPREAQVRPARVVENYQQ